MVCKKAQVATVMLIPVMSAAWAQESKVPPDRETPTLETVEVRSAAEQVKQAPGVSTITAEDIQRTPVTNDVSEIVRRQPGVNLTGNTSSGQRGNNRQIDIRGMGPENTLILIDGKPVLSRNSVRYSVQGERDTRGDSNWVPPEAIESIEVLRGPAAARYGSGAAGGVVNIRTKAATRRTFNVNVLTNLPEDSAEGDTRRVNVLASGPVNEALSYRLYGNFNVTEHDKPGINPLPDQDAAGVGFLKRNDFVAGREGVKNRDLSGRLSYRFNADHRVDLDASWSRQGNRFAGDALNAVVPKVPVDPANPFPWAPTKIDPGYLALIGKETNRMTRSNVALTHYGRYSFGTSESYIQFERTDNERYAESLGGGTEGSITTSDLQWNKTPLKNLSARSEFDIPLKLGYEQVLTVGADLRRESMNDPGSIKVDLPAGLGGSVAENAAARSTQSDSRLIGVYLEDNIYVGKTLVLTPGLRYDHHSEFGGNTSPSLNASWQLDEQFTLKGGVARAFKAPNLYQLNPNYTYNSAGIGCWQGIGPCYIIGNRDLKPEISLNKEIGISFRNHTGWAAGATFFHNRYKNHISSGRRTLGSVAGEPIFWDPGTVTRNLLQQWENRGPATIAGLEGNLSVPLRKTLTWSSNVTYMSKSEDDQGQPLSLIPKYTINTWLDWQATTNLGFNLGVTHYGKTKARQLNLLTGNPEDDVENPAFYGDPLAVQSRKAYTLANLGLNYQFNKTLRISAGVKNLFDKQLKRTHNVGANSYNEPGRSYYAGLNTSF